MAVSEERQEQPEATTEDAWVGDQSTTRWAWRSQESELWLVCEGRSAAHKSGRAPFEGDRNVKDQVLAGTMSSLASVQPQRRLGATTQCFGCHVPGLDVNAMTITSTVIPLERGRSILNLLTCESGWLLS